MSSIVLKEYFRASDHRERNTSILNAFLDGYSQADIANHLRLSTDSVSRIVCCERGKRKLFTRIKNKGLFWSYATDIEYNDQKSDLLIETVLKYGGLDDINTLLKLFGVRRIKKVWENRVKDDARFRRLNLFLARILFRMNVEAKDFAHVKNTRAEKFQLLAG